MEKWKEYFKEELEKEENENENENEKEEEEDEEEERCTISKEKKDDTYIKLECGHGYNYVHIYREVYKQKREYVKTETQFLKGNEIKCPYCRNIQEKVLPIMEGYPEMRYVNGPKRIRMKRYRCKRILKRGKRKGEKCGKESERERCVSCERIERNKKV